jgi:hypothetical protein
MFLETMCARRMSNLVPQLESERYCYMLTLTRGRQHLAAALCLAQHLHERVPSCV